MSEKVMEVRVTENKREVRIPKPKALIGGGEVYQEADVPYWYCKIKDGRDTFMHLYIEDLTEKDLLYDPVTGKRRKFVTRRQKKFVKDVLIALRNKPKAGFTWIPAYEPSLCEQESIKFVEGEEPFVNLSYSKWEEFSRKYSPDNESEVSSKNTCFLLFLRWLKDGIATIEQLADDSTKIGHFYNSKGAKGKIERTGKRRFGGVYGFVGNTSKIVKDLDSEAGASIFMGDFYGYGYDYTASVVSHIASPTTKYYYATGLLELKK